MVKRNSLPRTCPGRGAPRGKGIVRIIGGMYKRTPLPVADRPGLRPTPDRVRETVFDWLTHLLAGDWSGIRVLDMFAGSGAMALEALSRGASHATAIEKDRAGAKAIAALVNQLGADGRADVVSADALVWTQASCGVFDIVFIDPPFASRLQLKAAEIALPHLTPAGLVYIESEEEIPDESLQAIGLASVRRGKAGAVTFLLAKRNSAP